MICFLFIVFTSFFPAMTVAQMLYVLPWRPWSQWLDFAPCTSAAWTFRQLYIAFLDRNPSYHCFQKFPKRSYGDHEQTSEFEKLHKCHDLYFQCSSITEWFSFSSLFFFILVPRDLWNSIELGTVKIIKSVKNSNSLLRY